ncbi:MAG: hypothetical protein EOP46_05525 [Sphingobacteriaceae bacterium]|nr:MAG: hypothetical protein EOP46_05525 [Sphingobacteriaceae bacterium]
MINLIAIFLMALMPQQRPVLGLQAELKQDANWLNNGHIEHNKHVNFNLFKKYALMNLSAYTFSDFTSGNHKVSKWESPAKNQLTIYKIDTTMPVDTTFTLALSDSIGSDGKRVGINTSVQQIYHLVTFIIKPKYGNQLVYITHKNGGLYKYSIGRKDVYPAYEELDTYLNNNEKSVLNEIKQAAFK